MVLTNFSPTREKRQDQSEESVVVVTPSASDLAPDLETLPQSKRDFSFHLFWLIFWLTVISTVLLSWSMITTSPTPLDF